MYVAEKHSTSGREEGAELTFPRADRVHRPLPATPLGLFDSHLGDYGRVARSRQARVGSLRWDVELLRVSIPPSSSLRREQGTDTIHLDAGFLQCDVPHRGDGDVPYLQGTLPLSPSPPLRADRPTVLSISSSARALFLGPRLGVVS